MSDHPHDSRQTRVAEREPGRYFDAENPSAPLARQTPAGRAQAGPQQALATLDHETGAYVDQQRLLLDPSTYAGIATQPVTEAQAAKLLEPVSPEEVEVKPDARGTVYLSHAGYRRRLNGAFGPRGWALRPLSPFFQSAKVAYQHFGLYTEGIFSGYAMGECDIESRGQNDPMSQGDMLEAIKSNALMRCCKDLGMAMDLWSRPWVQKFLGEHCVKVFVKRRDGSAGVAWRRLDALPIYGETGLTEDSPNQDRYTRPAGAQSRQASTQQHAPRETTQQRPAPRQTNGGETSPNAGDKRPISEAQGKRMFAIAKTAGWHSQALARLVHEVYEMSFPGEESHSELPVIPRSIYDDICAEVEGGSPRLQALHDEEAAR